VVPRLVVPYTLDTNDMRFALPQGFAQAEDFFIYLRDSFDALYAEGDASPKMLSIGMHCRLLGRPGRIVALQRFLDHVQKHDKRLGLPPHRHRPPLAGHPPLHAPAGKLNMAITLEQVNTAPRDQALQLLDGLYEHSPWVAEKALDARPFRSLAHLKHAMARMLREAGKDAQVQLIQAHPELAGKAMVSKTLTAESTHEQGKAGLADCTPEEFATLQKLNTDYNAKFGFPFILAVRGPRGTGLTRQQIIDTFARRLQNHPDFELQENLRNIHRVVETAAQRQVRRHAHAGQRRLGLARSDVAVQRPGLP
jgi:OHCU decarboxylase